MYICTIPRMRTLTMLCTALAAIMLGLPLSAESGRTQGSTAQSQLEINVIVMPVIIPPRHHHKDRDRDEEMVSYDFTRHEEKLYVTEETRPMLVEVQGKGVQQQPVQLTTMVAR